MDSSKSARDIIAKRTFFEFGTERLLSLCSAVGGDRNWAAFQNLFQRMVQPWGHRLIGDHPLYASDVADDGAPFEFSLALSKEGPEVQVYMEPLGEPATPRTNMRTGRAVLEMIAGELGAPLDRLRPIEHLFFPEDPRPPFTLWIGASWAPGRDIKLKVYLNPSARGRENSLETISLAMDRLGLLRAWSAVRAKLARTDERRDEVGIVCLDLTKDDEARVKIYIRHHCATAQDIDVFARATGEHEPEQVAAFYRILAENEGPFLGKPALTQVALISERPDRPASTTLTFPIGKYVKNDAIACERIKRCLTTFDLPVDAYTRALQAFALRPLDERSGIHAHVTLRRLKSGPRVGVYFASEAYVVTAEATRPPSLQTGRWLRSSG